MPNVEYAVIAAAGTGSRLGQGIPKCLIEVDGKTLLNHLLERLVDVPNIHISVGFMADSVIAEARKHRPDAVFVVNHAFRTTTTLTSYVNGARGVTKPVLYMDADIYFPPASFASILTAAAATSDPLIAVTSAKTEHSVFVQRDEAARAIAFSRTERTPFEWANVAWLPEGTLTDAPIAVFEQLATRLPIQTVEVESYEVDTPDDYQALRDYFNSSGR